MSRKFRDAFKLINKNAIHWFPGHMGKGLRQMQQKLKSVDCIIEVHDSRIPLSGRNPEFKYTVSGIKPHILVLNKKDLSNVQDFNRISEKIKKDEGIDEVLYTNCKDQKCNGIKRLMPTARELIINSNRFNRSEVREYCIMVIGVPNVGKSSLLNVLRNRNLKKKKGSAVGAEAGVTRSVLNKIKICDDPVIYMIDTPGILEPRIKDPEAGLKLALCSCFKDHLVGEDIIADYLLYWLNKNRRFEYVKLLDLEEPSDEITGVLLSIAIKKNFVKKIRQFDGNKVLLPDLSQAAKDMIKLFRTGVFGKCNLDCDAFN